MEEKPASKKSTVPVALRLKSLAVHGLHNKAGFFGSLTQEAACLASARAALAVVGKREG